MKNNNSTYSKFIRLKEKEQKVLRNLMRTSYFRLSSSDQKTADQLYRKRFVESFTFSIDPRVLQKINRSLKRYAIFIDCRRADIYSEIKKYLHENRLMASGFCTTGDADYVITCTTYKNDFDKFKNQLLEMLKNAPLLQDENVTDLINSYELRRVDVVDGKRIDGQVYEQPEFDLNFLTKLHLVLNDYRNKKNRICFTEDSEVKSFLDLLKRKKVLVNYRIIRDFLPIKIRVYILLLYTEPQHVEKIMREGELLKPIVELSAVTPIEISDEFYNRVNYLICAEFDNLNRYHKWKESIYKIANRVNVFSFNVEARISELPEAIGNYIGFFELCSQYSKGIRIGQPIFLNPEPWKADICLNFEECMGQHGLICGGKDTGKTSTMVLLANKFLEKEKYIFIVDKTEGSKNAFSKIGKEFYEKNIREVYWNDAAKVDFKRLEHRIYLFRPKDDKELSSMVGFLLDKIKEVKKEKERNVDYVYFFEEADVLFTMGDGETAKSLFSELQYVGRECVSVWLSVHAPSHLVIGGKNLGDELKNRIFHRLDTKKEAEMASEFLTSSIKKEESLYPNIAPEITELGKGECFLSFWSTTNNLNLAPIKVKIDRVVG